ncbi:MAG TPA: hypothetical protein VHF88_10165 [Thermoleophilaceae bacterium]|nr:hypothetical protein [Thermoleophilaceae bacterium]
MVGGTIRRRLVVSVCALALGPVAAACGSDGDDGTAKSEPRIAAASEPEDVFIERMAKLLETTSAKKDCAQLEEINVRSFTRFPCPPAKDLRKSMASFEVVDTEDYGTGAVIDYKSGKAEDGAAIVLFVAPDRNWGIGRFGLITEPSIGTSDEESRSGYAEAVDKYLDAVRDRDCAAFKEVTFHADADQAEICETSFAGTEDLAKRLKADPSAEPIYQGGNRTYGFFTLETSKPVPPENSTISVIRAAGDSYLILDVAPSPTADEQRRVRQQLREQQRKGGPSSMEPSSKPSDPAVRQ